MIRPEQIVADPDAPTKGTVRTVRFEGAVIQLDIDVDGLAVIARWPATHHAAPGDVVAVAVSGVVNAYPGPESTPPDVIG